MDEYPKPGIPPESAWADMKLMLDKELPLPDSGSGSSGFEWIKAAKILLTTILITAALIITYVVYMPQNDQSQKSVRNDSSRSTAGTAISADDRAIRTGDKSEKAEESVHENRENLKKVDSSDTLASNKALRNGADLSADTLNAGALDREKPDLNTPKKKDSTINLDKGKVEPTSSNNRLESTTKPTGLAEKTSPQNRTEKPKRNISLASRNVSPVNSNKYNSTSKSSVDPANSQTSASELLNSSTRTSTLVSEISTPAKPVANPASASADKSPIRISLLEARKPEAKNPLASRLKLVQFRSKQTGKGFKSDGTQNLFFKNMHAGLYWNAVLPFSGFDHYFLGTNATRFKNTSVSNEFYKILFPGAWVSKTLGYGGEVLIKIKPYNQQFGNPNRADSSGIIRSDTSSTYYTLTRSLLKSSGLNLGLQYNHPINDRWAIGIGTGIQWQRKALVSNHIEKNLLIDYVPLVSVSSKGDTSAYLRPYFFTGSAEVLYTLKKLQIGAGITLPVTSMLGSRYPNLRPVKGQVTVRWRFR